jgi:hypothetical protein
MSKTSEYIEAFKMLSSEELDKIYHKYLNGDNQGMGKVQREALSIIWHENNKEIKGK